METLHEREFFLTDYMLKYSTDLGFLSGTLLNSEDIDDKWKEFGPDYCADAVTEFNAYPEFCLACAGFLGMAVASLWDADWNRYSTRDYAFYKGPGGFDTMDEHILWKLLNLPNGSQKEHDAVNIMQSCSSEMYHLMSKSTVERGTADAYRLFMSAMTVMFKLGEAIELHKLGYKLEKLKY